MYDRWSAAVARQSLQKVPGLKKLWMPCAIVSVRVNALFL